jgi:antitoxin ParD1/3/4
MPPTETTTPIALDLDQTVHRFIEREVAEGRFRSAGEVVEAALQLLEERETRLRALRSIIEGAQRA